MSSRISFISPSFSRNDLTSRPDTLVSLIMSLFHDFQSFNHISISGLL